MSKLSIISLLLMVVIGCTKTEYVDKIVEKVVKETDTVYVEKIVTEYDTVYLDKIIETSKGIKEFERFFSVYNTPQYPGAYASAKKLIKGKLSSESTTGTLIYFGKYNYELGSFDTDITFHLLYLRQSSIGVYKACKVEHYWFNRTTNKYELWKYKENANGLPNPQKDFSKNAFISYINKKDLDLL